MTQIFQKPLYEPHPSKVDPRGCISFIGMAAAGKTTIGRELSHFINWLSLDADHLIESVYGVRLQEVADALDKEAFLDLEATAILSINVKRTIISTGGSAVYRPKTMEYLRSLGPVIYISVPLPIILTRVARKPERGLAMNPGQTVEDLYHERAALYKKYATWTIEGGEAPAAQYAEEIARWLSKSA
jgi:Shikimate kinase